MVTEKELQAPLQDGLDYYDATPTIEECLKLVQQLHERTNHLEAAASMQLTINQSLMDLLRTAHDRLAQLEENGQKPSALILPPRLDS